MNRINQYSPPAPQLPKGIQLMPHGRLIDHHVDIDEKAKAALDQLVEGSEGMMEARIYSLSEDVLQRIKELLGEDHPTVQFINYIRQQHRMN